MNFKDHSEFEGQHAFLSASNYHWINYTDEKLIDTYSKHLATMRGTIMHDFAAQCIRLGQKLPKSKKTLNMYVNDAIGYKMIPEQILMYSENCFGTADAIKFKDGFLRVHDYKSGETKASMKQLWVYVALFCLEYKIKPGDIEIECRLYQYDDYEVSKPTAEDIVPIMDKIIRFDKIIRKIKEQEG